MNKITVTIFGQNIKDSIRNGNYQITYPVTFAPSGEVMETVDLSEFLEFLETDYIDNMDTAIEQDEVDYYSDTILIEGESKTELYFETEYPYIYAV